MNWTIRMINANYWKKKGNTHIDMELNAILPYHEVVANLVLKHSSASSRILDLGCGLGQIEAIIHAKEPDKSIDIADAYPACIEATRTVGNIGDSFLVDECSFDLGNINKQKYDVAVMSHVLEHLIFPAKALDDAFNLMKDDGVLIVAVPNPVRPVVFFANLFKVHYVNRGHVHAWDPSHWKNFLENIMGYEIVEYSTDYIQLPRATRSALSRKIGKVLVKFAPWWGFSNIAVIRRTKAKSSTYSKYKEQQSHVQ